MPFKSAMSLWLSAAIMKTRIIVDGKITNKRMECATKENPKDA